MSEYLLWIDVETTGLDPAKDHLLEIAAVVTTFDASFAPVGFAFEYVLQMPLIHVGSVSPEVLRMHSNNGLWDACRESSRTVEDAYKEMGSWFAILKNNNSIDYAATFYAAGRSVHFDLAWLPDLLTLHHRRFDLTPIKAFAKMCGYEFDVPEDAHRALADVEADIELARRLVKTTARPPAAASAEARE